MIYKVEFLDWRSVGSIEEHYLVDAESEQSAIEKVRELLKLPIEWENVYGNYLEVIEQVDLAVPYMVYERDG